MKKMKIALLWLLLAALGLSALSCAKKNAIRFDGNGEPLYGQLYVEGDAFSGVKLPRTHTESATGAENVKTTRTLRFDGKTYELTMTEIRQTVAEDRSVLQNRDGYYKAASENAPKITAQWDRAGDTVMNYTVNDPSYIKRISSSSDAEALVRALAAEQGVSEELRDLSVYYYKDGESYETYVSGFDRLLLSASAPLGEFLACQVVLTIDGSSLTFACSSVAKEYRSFLQEYSVQKLKEEVLSRFSGAGADDVVVTSGTPVFTTMNGAPCFRLMVSDGAEIASVIFFFA